MEIDSTVVFCGGDSNFSLDTTRRRKRVKIVSFERCLLKVWGYDFNGGYVSEEKKKCRFRKKGENVCICCVRG